MVPYILYELYNSTIISIDVLSTWKRAWFNALYICKRRRDGKQIEWKYAKLYQWSKVHLDRWIEHRDITSWEYCLTRFPQWEQESSCGERGKYVIKFAQQQRTCRGSKRRRGGRIQAWKKSPSCALLMSGRFLSRRTYDFYSGFYKTTIRAWTPRLERTYLLALNATKGALRRNAIHWPDSRNNKVRKACAEFSGKTNCKDVSARKTPKREWAHLI